MLARQQLRETSLIYAHIPEIEYLFPCWMPIPTSQQRICYRGRQVQLRLQAFRLHRRLPLVIRAIPCSPIFVLTSKRLSTVKRTAAVQLMFFVSHPLNLNMRRTYSAHYMLTSSSPSWLQDQKERKCPVEISSRLCPILLCFRLIKILTSSMPLHCLFSNRFIPIEARISGYPQ